MDSWGVYVSRIILEFFPKPVYPTMVAERFQIYDAKITGNYICESKNSICSFLLIPQSKTLPQVIIITPPPPRRREISIPPEQHFLEIYFFPSRKGGWGEAGVGRWGRMRIMELKKLSKLILWGYWSQVLINPTIFETFTVLISVLLCHNLASSMLKCEASLTYLIRFSLKSIVCRNNCMKYKTFPYPFF